MWTRSLACFLALTAMAAPATVSANDDAPRWNDDWPRVQWWEMAGMTALAAEAFTVRFALDWEANESFDGDNFVDDWALENVRVRDADAYRAWVTAGDVPFYGSMLWSAADPLSVGLIHGSWDVAGQMMLMNVEAYAFYSAVLWTTQFFVRRERPQADSCDQPQRAADLDISCEGPDRYRSFIGGHVGIVTLNAALTCTHHSQMDLYGDAGDAIACGAATAAAGLTFVSRTVTAKHNLTDNVLGVGLGLVSGWLVPYALHYGQEESFDPDDLEDMDDRNRKPEGPRVVGFSLRPKVADRGLELGVLGTM